MQTLIEIGKKYGTDKAVKFASSDKSYLDIYERLLQCFDERKQVSIFEIGIRDGASANMFLERFPNARLVGLDIEACKFDLFDNSRFSFFKGNQSDETLLRDIALEHGPFDLVLDDGSHIASDYIASFRALFKSVKKNGLYIIEDLYNSYKEWNFSKPTNVNGKGEAFDEFNSFLIRNVHLGCAFDFSSMDAGIFSVQHFPGIMVVSKDLF